MPHSQAIKVFFSFFILSLDLHNILRDRVTSFVLIHKKCSLVSSALCTYSRISPFLFRRAGNGKTKEPFSRGREKGEIPVSRDGMSRRSDGGSVSGQQ